MKKKFLSEGISASKVELNEVRQVEESTSVTESEPNLIRSNLEPNIQTCLRRSDRVPHQSDRYLSFLVRDGDSVELDENNEDPVTYVDAIQRFDSKKWLEAIKFKMESWRSIMCGH